MPSLELQGLRLPEVVKNVAFGVRAQSPEHTVFIGATFDPLGKPLLTLMVTEDLVKEGMNASSTARSHSLGPHNSSHSRRRAHQAPTPVPVALQMYRPHITPQ